jgi:hypothetical protein
VAKYILVFASCNGWRPVGWQADVFQRQGKRLRRKMWFENMKVKLIVLAIIVVIAIVIWLSICHGFVCHKSSSSSNSTPTTASPPARRLLAYDLD